MKTISEKLQEYGFELTLGYTLEFGKDPDYNNIVISREDIEKFYNLKPEPYYWNESYADYYMDEEQAWENFYESYCMENDLDIDIEEFEKMMLK